MKAYRIILKVVDIYKLIILHSKSMNICNNKKKSRLVLAASQTCADYMASQKFKFSISVC